MVKRFTNPFAGRPVPLGSLITAAGRRLSAELDEGLRAAGLEEVRAAHAPLFMAIDPDGSTVTELARRALMTKQAMGELVRHLSASGYVEVSTSPHDRRARIVRLTDRGWETIRTGVRIIDEFDAWLETTVGADRVDLLREVLTRIEETPQSER